MPTDMPLIRLGNYLEVQAGFAFKTEHFTTAEGMPLIRIRDLANSHTEINYSGEYKPDFVVHNGDYLIGMDGNFRCYRWQGGVSLLNQRVCRLHNFREGVEPEYIFYGIQQKLKEIENSTSFVTVKHLSAKQVQGIEMPLPPLPEQRRIVDLLARAEGVVRLRREAEKKAAELIPALFLDMFGDPATNPKGWPEHNLGDIADVVSGVTKGRKFGDKQTVEVPYLRVANVQAGHIDLTEVKTIEVLPRDVEQLALQNGDVVLTEGGDFDKLGRGALWEHNIANCVHQNHVFRVRCNRSVMLPQFFVIYLQSSRVREYFLRCAKRTTNLASINMTQLRALPVVLPAMDAQWEFVERFAAGRSIQSQQSSATTKAQETFNALLSNIFTNRGRHG
ncbi:Type I restriction enzyme (fragment) [Sterolibacterium denitrificans]|uniref:Type I restriction enzyme n=1 Tax=Sterolibacterium denitrificans TaxID=157592 RepID=A0A7Z7MVV1_9PROT